MEAERQYQPGARYHAGPNRFTFFAGVIMPTISITLEATTHICADVFFDPIPTIWHLLLVIFVPLAQLQVWFAIRRGDADRLALAGFINAVVIGISIFYSIVYLPLLPLSMLALLFGLGVLPLAPFLSLLAGLHWTEYRMLASGQGPFNNGRYLLPLVGIAGLAVATALRWLRPAARSLGVAGTLAALLVLNVLSLGLCLERFYA